jgi:hypothetical protein
MSTPASGAASPAGSTSAAGLVDFFAGAFFAAASFEGFVAAFLAAFFAVFFAGVAAESDASDSDDSDESTAAVSGGPAGRLAARRR